MAAGLPILSSNAGPMPEVLGDAGLYFDPNSTDEIVDVLRAFVLDQNKRATLSASAFEKARECSWDRCAADTFAFIADVARQGRT